VDQMWFVMGMNLLVVLALMICVWPFSIIKKDSSIVDVFWGIGFVLIAWNTFFHAHGILWRKLLIATLTTIWGLRLSFHIYARNLGKGEDSRYQAFRKRYGNRYWLVSLFTVFILQALLLWAISLVIQAGQVSQYPRWLTWLDALGVAVWAVGFAFEAVSDWQLTRFKADPSNKGRVMDQGLWAYSRHPNYFGESLVWWGMLLITLSNPINAWTIVSPLLITFLLLKVSGVALMEKTIVENRPEYRDYINRTSAFVPWFTGGKRSSG
jgi:steroid 5-alpha reductase family enzyme